MSGVLSYSPETNLHRRRLLFPAVLLLLAFGLFCWRPAAGPASLLYRLLREQAKNRYLSQLTHLSTQESEHFRLLYDPEDAAYSDLVLATAEAAYSQVGQDLRYTPPGKTVIVLYPDREELNASFGWPAQASAMGVYWAGVIRVLSPAEWIKAGDPDALAAQFAADGPMAHEFAHLVLDYRAGGNYPRWFTEGVAQYEEYKLTGKVWSQTPATQAAQPYAWAELQGDFDRLPDERLAYYQSFRLVEYLVQQHGEDGLQRLIELLAEGYRFSWALSVVTGSADTGQQWIDNLW